MDDALLMVVLRWVHITAGVMWLGLLYFFNVVQVPAMVAATAEGPAAAQAIAKHVAPRALAWFRWASVATVLAGFAMLGPLTPHVLLLRPGYAALGAGVWLGLVMFFNVWALLWPQQKKALGLVQATPEQRAKARRLALLVSRVNLALSFPMLFLMSSSYLLHRPLGAG